MNKELYLQKLIMKHNKEFRSLSISMENESRTAHITIPYNTRSEYMGFWEVLAPGCFSKTLQENNIEIPFPQRDVYIRQMASPSSAPQKKQTKNKNKTN